MLNEFSKLAVALKACFATFSTLFHTLRTLQYLAKTKFITKDELVGDHKVTREVCRIKAYCNLPGVICSLCRALNSVLYVQFSHA